MWSVMSDPLGLSIGTTNLVAARVGNQPVIRRSVLTLFGHAAPEVGVPSAHTDGIVLSGFVERVGDPVPLVAADGSPHHADRLLVDALQAMVHAAGGEPSPDTAIAVPAHWGTSTLWALRNAMRANPSLAPNGTPVRLISDAVASLTALQRQSRPQPARCGGAAGLRRRRNQHHAWRMPHRRSSRSRTPPATRSSPATRSTRHC